MGVFPLCAKKTRLQVDFPHARGGVSGGFYDFGSGSDGFTFYIGDREFVVRVFFRMSDHQAADCVSRRLASVRAWAYLHRPGLAGCSPRCGDNAHICEKTRLLRFPICGTGVFNSVDFDGIKMVFPCPHGGVSGCGSGIFPTHVGVFLRGSVRKSNDKCLPHAGEGVSVSSR